MNWRVDGSSNDRNGPEYKIIPFLYNTMRLFIITGQVAGVGGCGDHIGGGEHEGVEILYHLQTERQRE